MSVSEKYQCMKSISEWKVLMGVSRGQESHFIGIQTKLRERTKGQLTGNSSSLFKEISFFWGPGVIIVKLFPFLQKYFFHHFLQMLDIIHFTKQNHDISINKQLCFSFKIISLRILFNCVLLEHGTKHVIGWRKWPMGLNIYHSLIHSTMHFFYFVLFLSNIQKCFFMEFSRKLFSYFV